MDELSPIKIGPLFCRSSVRLYLPSRHHGKGSDEASQRSRSAVSAVVFVVVGRRSSKVALLHFPPRTVLLQFTSPMQSRRVHQKVYVAHYVVFTPSWFAIQPHAIQRPRTTSAGHNGRKVHLKPLLGPNSKIGLSGLATVFSAIHCCSAGILLIGKNPMAISEDFVFSKTALILLIVLLKKFN